MWLTVARLDSDGVDDIRDDAPRFKVVLSEDNLQLYEIEKAA